VYADSSALVKLVVDEEETEALRSHLASEPELVVSRIALVEVSRAVRIASPGAAAARDAERLLASCTLVEVSDSILRAAAGLASANVRTLDAIHLASALRAAADEVIVYDRRLREAAEAAGFRVCCPGAG
jgi:predicted nucleic acid-binding protein